MILVVGARSELGRRVVERLVDAGSRVRATSRHPVDLDVPSSVETAPLDVREDTSLAPALRSVDAVVSAVHGLSPPTRTNHPGIVDGEGVRRLIDAATTAGVARFVLISAKGAAPDSPARFFRLKHQSEQHLRTAGMPWTILRPPAFMEVHALRLMGEPLLAGKAVPLIGGGHVPIDWISAADVAATVVGCIAADDCRNATIELSGPAHMSRVEALQVQERALGTSAKRRNLPVPAAAALGRIGGLVNPGLGYLIETALAEMHPPGHATPADREIAAATTLETVAGAWAARRRGTDGGPVAR